MLLKIRHNQLNYTFLDFWSSFAKKWQKISIGLKRDYLQKKDKNYSEIIFLQQIRKGENPHDKF